ncbi:hypothetical protein HELRODRAFT_78758, partial [Helobdella robusta]|uniref:Bifunctional glutamate/proline--tRNA ligase n=1 Tax=Helobdella robusta TaxID=6412 RepID=T1G3F3_HELRO
KSFLLQNFRNISLTNVSSICRFLSREVSELNLYGKTSIEKAQVDHWLEFSTLTLPSANHMQESIKYLDYILASSTYLVGDAISLADIFVWAALKESSSFEILDKNSAKHLCRYFNYLSTLKEFETVAKLLPSSAAQKSVRKERKEEGKFIDLPEAEMGKLVVRFPPEASGYLHIGHAKAALLNQYYQQAFKGKLIMRFDDTNPEKENAEFERVILDDVKMLGITPDIFTFTSDHFDRILDFCTLMIKNGDAYVDDTDPEVMKKEREERVESKNRNNSVEKNLSMWNEMQKGSESGLKCCVRAKLDMKNDNGCLRDPTMYRCKVETHVRTGDKYKVYPTYDFACPIVDSIEGVTHALRTMEYHDRDEQYYWFLKTLGLRRPYIWEYSRLNLQNTVMSKRKLTWIVDEGFVEGWDDPRFPTVRGVMRRGMTVEGLKEFVIAQGSSRATTTMDWDKIWAFNKKVIDPVAPRYTALQKDSVVTVLVDGAVKEFKMVQKHPKDPEIGMKKVWYSDKVLIDGADAEELHVDEVVTFINWGNLIIKKIERGQSGKVKAISAILNLENKEYKKTTKLTWLAVVEECPLVNVNCCFFEHIISKPVLTKDDDFKQYINRHSKVTVEMLGDPELASVKKGEIIQLQRRGFFICDSAYESANRYSSRENPCILFNVPDGHTKEMPTSGSKHKTVSKDTAATVKEVMIMMFLLLMMMVTVTMVINTLNFDDLSFNLFYDFLLQPSKSESKKQQQQQKQQQPQQAPATAAPHASSSSSAVPHTSSSSSSSLDQEIATQGDLVRQLKSEKAEKTKIDAEVKKLLSLKADYKQLTGQDWKPGTATAAATTASAKVADTAVAATKSVDATAVATLSSSSSSLDNLVTEQGDLIRRLKSEKVEKTKIDAEVKKLLSLKDDYKQLTGQDWKPGAATATAAAKVADTTAAKPGSGTTASTSTSLDKLISEQGDLVRRLKSEKAEKSKIDTEVKKLLQLKADYKQLTNEDWKPGATATAAPSTAAATATATTSEKKTDIQKQKQPPQKPQESSVDEATTSREVKKVTRLGLEARKHENFSEWYSQVITKAELIEYYDVSGCYVLRSWSFGIWERISQWFDERIKEMGFENCYFPMFVSHGALETEKEHIADFAPEVAWVTKSGQTDLAEPIAIRPTSETVMYPSYAKWVQSHRDLPIKLNQWCNVVRWEFKHPQPFLRTREFLWQEGHSAHSNMKDAEEEVYQILDLYAQIYEELLAVPVTKGRKTEKEKFAGGDYTTTIEAYISASGRGIQAATSHHLGQNFSKMFDISFEDPETREKKFAYQNSWGLTTRSIGVVVMVHGDDKGLVLPPRIAHYQVVIVPCGITAQLEDKDRQNLLNQCSKITDQLLGSNVRVNCDIRDNYSPGWKFNHWELKGVPIRIEIGPKDLQSNQFVAVRRDTGEKSTNKLDNVVEVVNNLLESIHKNLYEKAKKDKEKNTATCTNFTDFCQNLDKNKLIMAPFCGDIPCEEKIKKLSARESVEEGAPAMGAKGLCIPFDQVIPIKDGDHCIAPDCKNKPKFYTLFGKSY